MLCYKCGYINKNGQQYCTRCGAVLDPHQRATNKVEKRPNEKETNNNQMAA